MNSDIHLLILGADGFIGRHFTALCDKYQVYYTKYTRDPAKVTLPNYVTGSVEDLTKELKAETIIVNISGNKKDESKMNQDNVELVQRLILISQVHNTRILHIGSAGIYGIANQKETFINENTEPLISNTYEKTKYLADQALLKSNVSFCILRPTNVIGEYDKEKKLLNLIKQIQKKRFFLLNRNAMTNYVYVGYLAQCMYEIISRNEFKREIFNINQEKKMEVFINDFYSSLQRSDQPPTLPMFLRPFIALIAKCSPLLPRSFQFITPSKFRELTSEKVISSQKWRTLFPELNHDIESGIHNLVTFYKENHLL